MFILQTTAQGRTQGNQGTSGNVHGLAGGNQQKGPCFLGDGEAGPGGCEEWAAPEVKRACEKLGRAG